MHNCTGQIKIWNHNSLRKHDLMGEAKFTARGCIQDARQQSMTAPITVSLVRTTTKGKADAGKVTISSHVADPHPQSLVRCPPARFWLLLYHSLIT